MTGSQRAIRVFVSSTFRDMQGERDELVKRVFPELRHRCEERGVTWGEVDLRWGVTDEEKAEGAVLPICLAEIERSRPFFIGLLGDRYGWVPDGLADDLRAQEPWLADAVGRSVTELEILHGVLNEPASAGRVFFYLRDPAYAAQQPPSEQAVYLEVATDDEVAALGAEAAEARAARRRQQLAELKARLRTSGHPVRDYADPIALGPLVLADLAAMVDALFPIGPPGDAVARAAGEQSAYATALTAVVVGRAGDLSALDAAVAGEGPPVLVTGEGGIGKSTLLAAWAARREPAPIVHHVAASPEAADWTAMLRRLIAALAADDSGDGVDPPADADGLKAAFAEALRRAGGSGPAVIVLDGIDELEDRDFAPDLAWLPWSLPPGVRLIVSAASQRTREAALARGFVEHRLAPLDERGRRELAVGFLARYAKRLAPELLDRLATHERAGNPLYLRAVCDEIRQHGDHFTLGTVLDGYLAAVTVDDLFERILARWERDYERECPGLVGRAMSALWAARRGLAEAELLELLGAGEPLPHAVWSPLHLAAGESLSRRNGLIGPAHDHLRRAIADRYLPTPEHGRAVHLRLGDYFAGRPVSPRVVDELPWQLRHAEDWNRLAVTLADPEVLAAAYRTDLPELRTAWAALEGAGAHRMVDTYRAVVDDPASHSAIVWEVARLLTDGGEPAAALALHRYLVDDARARGDERRLGGALANLAAAHLGRQELAEAEAVLAEQEAISRRLGDDRLLQAALGNQAVLARSRHELDIALALMSEEEAICRRLDDGPGLQSSLGNQGAVLRDRRDFDGALARFGDQERAARQVGDGTLVNRALVNQAQVLADRGEVEAALGLLARQERECRQHGDLANLAVNVGNRAAICLQQGRLDEAAALAAEEADLADRLGNRASLVRALFVRASIAHQRADRAGALALRDEHEGLARDLDDRSGLAMGLGERATLLREAGDLDGALGLHIEEERIYRELGDSSGVATSLGNQALVRHAAGDPGAALALVGEQERMLREQRIPAMLQAALGNKAAMAAAVGDLAAAEAALAEQDGLCREIGHRAGLASCLGNRATIALQSGDGAAAVRFLDEQLAIALDVGLAAVAAQNLVVQAKVRPAVGDGAGLHRVLAATEQQARSAGSGYVLAQCLAQRGTLALGTPAALELLPEAETAARSSGNTDGLQLALGSQGLARLQQGDVAGAEAALREQEAVCRQSGIVDGLSAALGNLAIVANQRGDSAAALELLGEQETLCRQHGDGHGLVLALANRGEVTAGLPGRRDEGLGLLDDAARTAQAVGWLAMVSQIQQLAAQIRSGR
jgi:ATP/maltotriose-dependent transcriptional regulator MalT